MKRTAALLCAISVTLGVLHAEPQTTPPVARFDWFDYAGRDPVYDGLHAGPGDYLNPILAGFYPDPSIVRVKNDYYLVNSTFAYFPGIPVFHSRDLVHWTQIGNAIDRPSQLKFDGLGISRAVFAPAISAHAGRFTLLNTCVDCGGNYLITATNPAGPWSDPVWLPFEGIDPSLFFDRDGKVYIVNNGPPPETPRYDGHRAIWLQRFDPATNTMTGPRRAIVDGGTDIRKQPVWIEGPHLFRWGKWYYLICAEGGTGTQHSEVVFRSRRAFGPYVPFQGNPILTQRDLDPGRADPVTSTGHAQFVRTQNGEWWAVFLATRPYADDSYNTGRETFLLPVTWRHGWPMILDRGRAVPYHHARPRLPVDTAPAVPTNGNFTVHATFDGPSLAPEWLFVRAPRERWYALDGALAITARPESIGGAGQPSYVGRRLQHGTASVSLAMRFDAVKDGDRAGLVAFQSSDHFTFLGLERDGGALHVRAEERAGAADPENGVVKASLKVTLAPGAPLYLRFDLRGAKYDLSYATAPDEWQPVLKDGDATILSTHAAGGFVGATVGMYAYRAP